MAQMCLVRDRGVPEGCAGIFITPFKPRGGLISSELLTEFMGEFSCKINNTQTTRIIQTHVNISSCEMPDFIVNFPKRQPSSYRNQANIEISD